jgi:hypothetical protein
MNKRDDMTLFTPARAGVFIEAYRLFSKYFLFLRNAITKKRKYMMAIPQKVENQKQNHLKSPYKTKPLAK